MIKKHFYRYEEKIDNLFKHTVLQKSHNIHFFKNGFLVRKIS